MSANLYIEQSEPAVRHLFDGLSTYDSIPLPSIMDYVDETGLVKMTKNENKAYLEAYDQYFELEFARASLAGSILQLAYVGIKRYSPVTTVSPRCSELGVNAESTAAKFCIGRDIKGIPEGLLIYAGRIQYNHWEEGELSNPITLQVFNELVHAYYDNQFFDMVYVLNYPKHRPVSHYLIKLELGWRTPHDYIASMKSMLLGT